MLTVEACRRLIGASGSALSDTQVARLRDDMYDLARVVVPVIEQDRVAHQRRALQQLPSDERDSIEERAAVLELDRITRRDTATRMAPASRPRRAAGKK